jgi:hypothetical protein
MKVTLATEISDHPFHKIFGDIPARSANFTHASVRHYSILSQNILSYESHSPFQTQCFFCQKDASATRPFHQPPDLL